MQNLMTAGAALAIDPAARFTNFSEALGYSLSTAFFGIAVVFGVLALIWGILEIFRVVFYTIPNRKKASPAPKTEAPVPVKTEVPATSAATIPNDEELVAAITAAISAFRNAEGVTGGFRVVSFKKR